MFCPRFSLESHFRESVNTPHNPYYVEYSGVIVTSYGYQPEQFDAVISLCGCGVNLPEGWTSRELFEDWFIDDSDGQQIEKFRAACDEIRQRVVELLYSMKASRREQAPVY